MNVKDSSIPRSDKKGVKKPETFTSQGSSSFKSIRICNFHLLIQVRV
jgi:hypothetical protein